MRILVFQHVAVEHPGVFREFWAEAGHEWTPIEVDAGEPIPDLAPFDLLVVMGGPMDVWQEDVCPWLVAEKAAIRTWVKDLGRPYLGICLGHQLLAVALGGVVAPMAVPEVGFVDVELTEAGRADALLAGFPPCLETFQWHGAEIATLPEGAVVLAANAACATQAIRWGRHAWGFQYHVEITPQTVPEWQVIAEYAASLVAALGEDEAGLLEARVTPRLPAFRAAAKRLHDNLATIVAATAAVA